MLHSFNPIQTIRFYYKSNSFTNKNQYWMLKKLSSNSEVSSRSEDQFVVFPRHILVQYFHLTHRWLNAGQKTQKTFTNQNQYLTFLYRYKSNSISSDKEWSKNWGTDSLQYGPDLRIDLVCCVTIIFPDVPFPTKH